MTEQDVINAINASGGGGADPDDTEIVVNPPTKIKRKAPRTGPLPIGDDGKPLPGSEPFTEEVKKDTRKRSELEKDLFRMPPEEFRKVQQRLFDGGFFSGDVESDDVRWGDQGDEDTLKAWIKAIDRTERFNLAGKDTSLNEIIDGAKDLKSANEKSSTGSKRQPLVVALSDPDNINKAVEGVARKVLGRKLSEAERERFVAFYHNLETSSQKSEYAAGESGGSFTNSGVTEGSIEAKIRQDFSKEAKRMDATNIGNEFFDLLGGVGGGS